MSEAENPISKHLLFIGDIVAFCLMVLALFFLIRYPIQGHGLLFRTLSAIVFIIIFGWKIFFIFALGVIGLNLIDVITHAEKYNGSITLVTKREVIFLSFGLAISMAIGFIFSTAIRTGKPDIEPAQFFSYFNVMFTLF